MSVTIQSMANDQLRMQQLSAQLATGNRVNSAADDAAGSAIIEQMTAQINGFEQATSNVADMQNLVRTAEGGLNSIDDSLQRVRELSLQASNGTLSGANREIIQGEINQIMQSIDSTVSNTEFNNQPLLDGSFANANTAASPDGTGPEVTIPAMSVAALGLEDFDVTGDFDIADVDAALATVSAARAELGALTNRFDNTMDSNDISALNLAAARSRVQDTDVARAYSEREQARLMQEFQTMMLDQEAQDMRARADMFMRL